MADRKDPEKVAREIKRKTRRKFSSEEKIRIVLEGLCGEKLSLTRIGTTTSFSIRSRPAPALPRCDGGTPYRTAP